MDTNNFKKRLQEELKVVEGELKDIAVLNTETGEGDARASDMETMSPTADSNEFADQLEDFEEHREELPALALRWSEIKHALEKIENGKFGLCEADNGPIEPERLEVNPAARTCKKHM